MMKKNHLVHIAAIVATVFLLAGCGGGGSGSLGVTGESGASGATATAAGVVTSIVFVQQWSEVLWGVVSNQTGTVTPSQTPPVDNGDGTWTSTFVTANGTTGTITTNADGSARIDVKQPTGVTQTITSSAPVSDGGSKVTTEWKIISSDGLSVNYTSVVDDRGTWWDIADDTTDLVGDASVPGSLTQTFTVATVPGSTTIRSEQSDGSRFTLRVPLTALDFLPDYSKDSTGRYTGPGFNISFTLTHPTATAGPTRWSAVSASDPANKVTGEFSLEKDFSGFGQIKTSADGKLSAMVSWKQNGDSHLDLVGGSSRETRPAGAALDYMQHRWQTLTALMAPGPGG